MKHLIGDTVINFDKRRDLSEVNTWEDLDFNYFIANHVLYEFEEFELHKLCQELQKHILERQIVIIIGLARQGL